MSKFPREFNCAAKLKRFDENVNEFRGTGFKDNSRCTIGTFEFRSVELKKEFFGYKTS